MKKILFVFTILLSFLSISLTAKNDTERESEEVDNSIVIDRVGNNDIQIIIPSPLFSFSEPEIKIKFVNPSHTRLLINKNMVEFIINGELKTLEFINGEASFKHRFNESKNLSIFAEDFSYNKNVNVIPLWAIILSVTLILLFILSRIFKKKN